MFNHMMVGSNDLDRSKAFYDAILGTLGMKPGFLDPKGRLFYSDGEQFFLVTTPIDGEAATPGNGMTIGFRVENEAAGDAWHKAGVEAGGTAIEDPPGVRENPQMNIYLAYLRDPDGNKLCAFHRVS